MAESSFGTHWWRESLARARLLRGGVAATVGFMGSAVGLSGCATLYGGPPPEPAVELDDGTVDVSIDALKLQQEEGWDVGQAGATLQFPDSSVTDIAGGDGWRTSMEGLVRALAPSQPQLSPYYVPTLFQSLVGPGGQRLRAVMRPIHTPEMDEDFGRGLALRAQFGIVEWPKDTAIIVDAPGPRALAVAAALADHFVPVFTFANWPHPLGVVPAHQTLAASLFYAPVFTAATAVRPLDAPPLFVLDANRLAPYRDADRQFDNRYFVQLPTAQELGALGVKHVLYVNADGARELDDLNGALVALCGAGVDVKMVALGDFVRVDEQAQLAENDEATEEPGDVDEEGEDEGEAEDGALFVRSLALVGLVSALVRARLLVSRRLVAFGALLARLRNLPSGRHHHCGHWPHHPSLARGHAHPAAPAAHWSPAPRGTPFGPGRVVNAPPAGFGRIAARASRSDGVLTGIRPGGGGSYAPVGGGHGVGLHGGAWRGGSVGGAGGPWHSGAHLGGAGGWHGSSGSGWQGSGGPHGGRFGSVGRAGGGTGA